MKKYKFSFVDLFAGIGGFRIALQSAGGKCVGFSEIAPDALNSYCMNYGEDIDDNLGDITKIENLPTHDFLTAGVPCQSWSIAGKNLGFDDSRGQLWNDALFLLKKSNPKVFIFENVKGLADPRNHDALAYISNQIKEAGYYAHIFLLNAYDYGVPQNRIRIYIIGFKQKIYYDRFSLPSETPGLTSLMDIIDGFTSDFSSSTKSKKGQGISINEYGLNDYFLFNDLRGGDTTIHSWDLIDTSDKEKLICNLLLQNRRKRKYGPLDGNPLSLNHFKELDYSISQEDIDTLVSKKILKIKKYRFCIDPKIKFLESEGIEELLRYDLSDVCIDDLKMNRQFKIKKIDVSDLLNKLEKLDLAKCLEVRYDFKNTKISTGLNGINRIFLPTSRLYPTLVASDTNDFVTEIPIYIQDPILYKQEFLKKIYKTGRFRRITKEEACAIQGFPKDFILPEHRAKWMKLIGNSVAVPLIKKLVDRVVATGIFDESDYISEARFDNLGRQSTPVKELIPISMVI